METNSSLRTALQLQLDFLETSGEASDQDESLAWELMRTDFEHLIAESWQDENSSNVESNTMDVRDSESESEVAERDESEAGSQHGNTLAAAEAFDHEVDPSDSVVVDRGIVASAEDNSDSGNMKRSAEDNDMGDWVTEKDDAEEEGTLGPSPKFDMEPAADISQLGQDHGDAARAIMAPESVECLGCLDIFSQGEREAFRTECDHIWCKSCINTMFLNATQTESNYPARCCDELHLHSNAQNLLLEHKTMPTNISDILDQDTRTLYSAKTVELRTSVQDRTYCADLQCSAFIPASESRPRAKIWRGKRFLICIECGLSTCPSCKKLMRQHHRGNCPAAMSKDAEKDELTLSLAKEKKWARCPKCNALVEKDGGCNDMRCKCDERFCYGCSRTWGSCACGRDSGNEDESDFEFGNGSEPGDLEQDEPELDESHVEDDNDMDDDDSDDEDWPIWRGEMDEHGRLACNHHAERRLDGGRCHGCLEDMATVNECGICRIQLCDSCLSNGL